MAVKRGCFITFEGLDGCGKSTQCARLAEHLRSAGGDVLATREPTDGSWGRRIRAMARSGDTVEPTEELRWFVEDRSEHVRDELEPALAAGRIVLCDRYTLSSVAYQGARGLDPAAILEQSESDFPVPDLTLLFSLPAAVGLERARARGGELEPAFEQLDFQQRVDEVFAAVDRPYVERITASGTIDEVEARVHAALRRLLPGLPV
jgi:dTMP kinase